jgi:hypothetical protein
MSGEIMGRRVFTDQDVTPNDTLLRKQLGTKIAFFTNILKTSTELSKKWQFINGNGWLLKVDDNYKVLYYLIACDDGIIVNLTVNDIEMNSFRKNEELNKVHNVLSHATKYLGGYAISFDIKNIEESRSVAEFLSTHIKERLSKQDQTKKPIYHRSKATLKKLQPIIK